jgi:hypothetical protein
MTIMEPSPGPSLTKEHPSLSKEQEDRLLKIYTLYRERISQEDNLINHRMSWLLWSQAIFFAFWIGLANGTFEKISLMVSSKAIAWALGIIAVIGGVLAESSRRAIGAAQAEIEYLVEVCHRRHTDLEQAARLEQIPSLVGHKRTHNVGHWVPKYSPFLFMVVWVVLIVFDLVQAFGAG